MVAALQISAMEGCENLLDETTENSKGETEVEGHEEGPASSSKLREKWALRCCALFQAAFCDMYRIVLLQFAQAPNARLKVVCVCDGWSDAEVALSLALSSGQESQDHPDASEHTCDNWLRMRCLLSGRR